MDDDSRYFAPGKRVCICSAARSGSKNNSRFRNRSFVLCAARCLVLFQHYGMAALAGLAMAPEVDALFVKSVVDMLDFSACNSEATVVFRNLAGEFRALPLPLLMQRMLAKHIASAVRARGGSRHSIESYNLNVLTGYLRSFDYYNSAAHQILQETREVPERPTAAEQGRAFRDLNRFVQDKVETIALLCTSWQTEESPLLSRVSPPMQCRCCLFCVAPTDMQSGLRTSSRFTKKLKAHKSLKNAYAELLLAAACSARRSFGRTGYVHRQANVRKFHHAGENFVPPLAFDLEVMAGLEYNKALSIQLLLTGSAFIALLDATLVRSALLASLRGWFEATETRKLWKEAEKESLRLEEQYYKQGRKEAKAASKNKMKWGRSSKQGQGQVAEGSKSRFRTGQGLLTGTRGTATLLQLQSVKFNPAGDHLNRLITIGKHDHAASFVSLVRRQTSRMAVSAKSIAALAIAVMASRPSHPWTSTMPSSVSVFLLIILAAVEATLHT